MTIRGTWRKLKHANGPRMCSWIPLKAWHRLIGTQLVIPRYHVVASQEPAHIDGLYVFREERRFREDLEFLLGIYAPVSLEDVINHLDGARRLPKQCFLVTLDDGFRQVYDVVAPILLSKGIPAVFFLNPSVIDNRELLIEQKKSLLVRALKLQKDPQVSRRVSEALSDSGIEGMDIGSRIRGIPDAARSLLDSVAREVGCDFTAFAVSQQPYVTSGQTQSLIQQGFSIGAHSMTHPHYEELTLEDQLAETRQSIRFLRERFDYDCEAFCFPYMDVGVGPEFFREIYADGSLKVSFGSDGMHRHFFPRNLERFKMEYSDLAALQIMAREYYLTLIRRPWWAGTIPIISDATGA